MSYCDEYDKLPDYVKDTIYELVNSCGVPPFSKERKELYRNTINNILDCQKSLGRINPEFIEDVKNYCNTCDFLFEQTFSNSLTISEQCKEQCKKEKIFYRPKTESFERTQIIKKAFKKIPSCIGELIIIKSIAAREYLTKGDKRNSDILFDEVFSLIETLYMAGLLSNLERKIISEHYIDKTIHASR